MIKHLFGAACLCVLFACGSNDNKGGSTDTKPSAAISDTHCYRYNDSSNTISLNVSYMKDSLSGSLDYSISEKDKNTGTILGEVKGDLMIADYTFTSEGKTSVRQVAFKRSGSSLIGGTGEMEEKDGRMVFKDISKVKFEPSIVLNEVNCN